MVRQSALAAQSYLSSMGISMVLKDRCHAPNQRAERTVSRSRTVLTVTTDSSDRRQRLRELVRAGDHDAFTGLYRDHVSAVFALAFRMTGSRSLAEEVTAETFLVAWRARATVEVDERPLLPWLLGIAARQSLNSSRGLRRRVAFVARRDEVTGPVVIEDFADETVSRLDDAELLRRTHQALGSLTRTEAEVVGLCVWSGLSYAEASEALSIPIGTVRSRLNRARTRLRALTADDRSDAEQSRTGNQINTNQSERATGDRR